ncbi:hypothetical protein [uncultured Eubacterium sp.]|uniref:hypothetical protein n=1 Tax=uncultured Eubacterium sp. TaxID=165185 RepID=UPI002670D7A1|nr:hypothetical protein [uncultured Eubacterium sp.]
MNKKIIVLCICLIASMLLIACETKNYSEESSNVETPTTNDIEEVEKLIYCDTMTLLEKDNMFLITSTEGNKYVIDDNGIIQENPENTLEFRYLKAYENDDESISVLDIFDNDVSDDFITNSDNEEIVDVVTMKDMEVVIVREFEETATNSNIILKMLDKNGNELSRIESNDKRLKRVNDSINFAEEFREMSLRDIEYCGDTVCRLGDISLNVKTGEIVSTGIYFDNGYGVDYWTNNIEDIHGKKKFPIDKSGQTDESVSDIISSSNKYRLSNGLFFNDEKKIFYDINLTPQIDLSKYDILVWEHDTEDYVLKDGYCSIQAKNPSGAWFSGIIDNNGKWVIELTKSESRWDLIGDIGNELILMSNSEGYFYFDTETKTIENIENIKCQNKYFLDGKMYCLLDSGEILCKDLKSNEDTIINIHKG